MFKINKNSLILIATLLLIIAVLIVLSYNQNRNNNESQNKQPVWDIARTLRYSFTIDNKSANPVQDIVFKTYSPLLLSSTQKLLDLNSTLTFNTVQDSYGNQEMIFEIDFIPPYGKKQITITAQLVLSKIVAGSENKDKLFMTAQPQIESDNKLIIELAKSFSGKPMEVQKSIYDWQVENMTYSGYGLLDKGALYALKNLAGDCTEFAYLNVALNRALGHPSRAVNGYVVSHDKKLHASGFHTWSEVWLDGGWQVVDAQKKEFMNNQQSYIAMNIVTNTDTHNKKQNFKRFWVSNPDLIVTMN